MIKNYYLTSLVFCSALSFCFGQVTFEKQSFETSEGTGGSLVFSTPLCTNGDDRWDYYSNLSSINPNDGSQFWGVTDLTPDLVTVLPTAHFSVTNQPALSTIPHTGPVTSTTFQFTYDPTILDMHAAEVTTGNDENPYTFKFEGLGSNSNASDIIASPDFPYPNNIPYATIQAAGPFTNTSENIGVFRFDIRDGGATTDSDALGTELTSITFDVGTTQINYIRQAGLFDRNAQRANNPTIDYGAGTISFSGLSGANFTAGDNSTLTLTLRVSFTTNVIDNEKLIFTITNATANSNGSVFGVADAGGAFSDNNTGNDRNRLEVVADRLSFNQQPSDTYINATMIPNVEVVGNDINNNLDLDWTGMVALTSTGTMTGGTLNSVASGGIASFNSIVHTALSPPSYLLNTTSTGLNTATSNPFNITTLPLSNGDYRTTGSGNWNNNQPIPAIWEQYDGTNWNVSNSPPYNTTNRIYIRAGHTINTNGSFGSSVRLHILDGGYFINEHDGTVAEVYIYEGGILNIRELFIVASSGILEVFDGGNITVDFPYSNPVNSLWNGTEIFHPDSNIILKDWLDGVWFVDNNTAVSANTYSSYTAALGNIILDFESRLDSNDDFDILRSGTSINLAHGDLIMRSNDASNSDIRLATTGTVTSGIGGDFIIENSYFGPQIISLNSSGTLNFTIMGSMELNAATLRIASGTNPTATVNIKGDLTITSSAVLDFNSTVNTSALVTINLKGDLNVAGSGLLQNSNSSVQGVLNLNGIGDGLSATTTQTIDIASTSTTENRYINFYALNGSYVQLINRDLELGTNGGFIVESGGVLDFGFNGPTALNIGISGSQTGTLFSSQLGSTLKITSPDGITSTANLGNVQVTPSNRAYNQTANFYYIGKENQVTGNALTLGSTVKNVFVNLDNDNLELRLTNRTGIADGGKLEIQQGTVIGAEGGALDTDDLDFYGDNGQLIMTGGEYRISTITANPLSANGYLPKLRKYGSYALSGGTIHINGSNAPQIVSGTPNYFNLKFSGSNISTSLPPLPPNPTYKGISNATSVSGTLTISEDAIVDIDNSTLGGTNTNLVMEDNARFIMAGSSATKPDATGTYTLSPNSTLEFNNDTGGLQQIRLTNPVPAYANIVVSGANVGTVALGTGPNSFIQFQPNGSFTVAETGTFKLSNSFGFSGATNTAISNVNNPTIALLDNSTVEYAGANQVITPVTTEYKNMTLSGSGIKLLGHPTDILVGEDLNVLSATLHINTDEAITVDEGVIISGGSLTIENSGSLVQLNETDTNSGNITVKRNAFIENYDYIYWASPITDFNTDDLFENPSSEIFYWDPLISNIPFGGTGQGYWIDATNQTMEVGKGYIARAPNYNTITLEETLFNNGVPNNGSINIDISRGSDNDGLNGDDDDDDWNLVGNPYPSAVSADAFLLENSVGIGAVIEGFIDIWTHGTAPSNIPDPFYENNGGFNYDPNDYVRYNYLGATLQCGPDGVDSSNNPLGYLCFDGNIATGQGFMVNMVDGDEDTQNVTLFKNSMRSKLYDNSVFFKLPSDVANNSGDSEERHRIWLDLASENDGVKRILIGYATNATMGRDILYDAKVSNIAAKQNFYSIIDTNTFNIQGRALPFTDTDVVPLGFNNLNDGDMTLAIDAVDGIFENDQTIYLKDNFINYIHNLSEAPYTFTSDAGEFNSRFEIVFRADALSTNDHQIDGNELTIFELNNGDVRFKVDSNLNITEVEILDVAGRQVYNLKGNASTEVYALSQLSKAAYIAKVTLSNGQVITKKAIKQK